MMDEFNAYYHDAAALWLTRKYYEANIDSSDVTNWSYLQSDLLNSINPYYEFRLFMGMYLTHAKKQYPDIYQDMYNNQSLRAAFTLVNDLYAQLIQEIQFYCEQNIPVEIVEKKDDTAEILTLDFSGSNEDLVRFASMIFDNNGVKDFYKDIKFDFTDNDIFRYAQLEDPDFTEDDFYIIDEAVIMDGKRYNIRSGVDKDGYGYKQSIKNYNEFYKDVKKYYKIFTKQLKKELKKAGGDPSNPHEYLSKYGMLLEKEELNEYLFSLTSPEMLKELESFHIEGLTIENWQEKMMNK